MTDTKNYLNKKKLRRQNTTKNQNQNISEEDNEKNKEYIKEYQNEYRKNWSFKDEKDNIVYAPFTNDGDNPLDGSLLGFKQVIHN